MADLITAGAMAGWLWIGFFLGERHARKRSGHDAAQRLALRLLSDLIHLKKTMKFVGPGVVGTTTSEWTAGSLGKFKITVEPMEQDA